MTHPLSRRTLLRGAATATLALPLLAACGGDASGRSASGRGGTLTIGFDNEPVGLDPALSAQISSDRSLLNLFFDTLIRQDRDGSFQPALAERWTFEGTTATFALRQGVTFHDGTPFDAEAAAFNLRRVIDPATKSTKASALGQVAAVDVVDPQTLRLTLTTPDPLLLIHLAHEPGMMSSPTAVTTNGADYGRGPVGTGPYTLDSWRTKVQLTARRNPRYWRTAADGQPLPKLDTVVVRFLTDITVLRTEIATGGIQLLRVLPPEEFGQLAGNRQVVLEDIGVRRAYYVSLNVTRPPFDNPAARAAFISSVDREGIGRVAAAGEFDLAPSLATTGDWFFDGSLAPTPFGPDRAAAAFVEAGLSGSVPITLLARRRSPDSTIAELLQAQLAPTGFAASVEVLESATQLERMRNKDFDASVLVIDVPRLDPSLSFDPYFTSTGSNNWSGITDPELDRLLAEAARSADQATRKRLYVEAQRQILAQDYWAFLHQPRSPLIRRANLTGIVLNTDGQWRLDEAYLA